MNRLFSRLLMLCLFAATMKAQEATAQSTFQYTIQYTGRTFGYARIPDRQIIQYTRPTSEDARIPARPTPSPNQDADRPNQAAAAYCKLFASKEGVLRLGLGDNFAPNFLARVYEVQESPNKLQNPSKKPVKEDPKKTWCEQAPEILIPKDRFYLYKEQEWRCMNDKPGEDATGNTMINYDNVAQFFIANNYNALVPGKHDFYFGPEWLRDVARLLAKSNVHMLGANLAISTARGPDALNANTYPRIADRYAGLRYETDFDPVSIDLPDMVFPYKRQFVIKNARRVLQDDGLVLSSKLAKLERKSVTMEPLVAEAYVCEEPESNQTGNMPSPRDPRRISLPDDKQNRCTRLVPAETACAAGSGLHHLESSCKVLYSEQSGTFNKTTDRSHPSADETYLFQDPSGKLVADRNYLFCVHFNETTPRNVIARKNWTCTPFSVQQPLFAPLDPYELFTSKKSKTSEEFKIAVFGVVDPDLLSNVGLVNDSWLNTNHRLDTALKVAPADYALEQALEQCNSIDACRQARKVVMAQMSWAKASQLIARFGKQFDLAISQADDDHDPGNSNSSGMTTESHGPRLLIAPPNPAPPTDPFTPKLSTATIRLTITKSGKDASVAWCLHNRVASSEEISDFQGNKPQCVSPSTCMTIEDAAKKVLAADKALRQIKQPQTLAPDSSETVSDLALHAMRQSLHADIAVLQQRDIYNGNNGDDLSSMSIQQTELQNHLQRIFWKGDFVTTLHVTGATLRKIMKQSKKFDELDHDRLSTDLEKGRSLKILGLWTDPKDSDTLYVNGTALDDSALYSVAATQYLALGDTGYADLATPDVPPAYRIEDFEHMRPLAQVVCASIRTKLYPKAECDQSELDEKFFDPSAARPFDETAGFNAASHYTTFPKRLATAGDVPTAGLDGRAEQRPFLAVNLENLDVAYTGTYISHVQTTGKTFAGVSASGVTTTGNNNLGTDHRLRAIYDLSHGTFYLLSDSSFMRTSTTTSVVPTLATNMVGFEGGGTIRLLAPTRPSWLSFQYASRFEGQLTNPSPIQVTPTASPGKAQAPPSFFLPSPQTSTLSGRLGLRIEHADTYIEAGVEEVDARHILSAYQFTQGDVQFVCMPSSKVPLAQVICEDNNKNSVPIASLASSLAPTVQTSNYLTGGAYLNFIIKFPLWSRRDATHADQSWYFTLANHGDFYFNSHADTSTQTRYLDKFTPSFSIPLYGKLSLTPKVDFILYENKVFRKHYRVVEPSLSLSYSFKWREGMGFARALGYGAITTTASTAGSLPQK